MVTPPPGAGTPFISSPSRLIPPAPSNRAAKVTLFPIPASVPKKKFHFFFIPPFYPSSPPKPPKEPPRKRVQR
jgi:hypothetical protein